MRATSCGSRVRSANGTVELREMTRTSLSDESESITSSTMPSANQSSDGSPVRLTSGMTAMEGSSSLASRMGRVRSANTTSCVASGWAMLRYSSSPRYRNVMP